MTCVDILYVDPFWSCMGDPGNYTWLELVGAAVTFPGPDRCLRTTPQIESARLLDPEQRKGAEGVQHEVVENRGSTLLRGGIRTHIASRKQTKPKIPSTAGSPPVMHRCG